MAESSLSFTFFSSAQSGAKINKLAADLAKLLKPTAASSVPGNDGSFMGGNPLVMSK
jgi:hypothetical protein